MFFQLIFVFGFAVLIQADPQSGLPIKLCVSRQVEVDKCNELRRIALEKVNHSRIDCIFGSGVENCIRKVKDSEADIIVLDSRYQQLAKDNGLTPMAWETYRNDDVVVALADEKWNATDIKTKPLFFNSNDLRVVHSMLFFNEFRLGKQICEVKRSQKQIDSVSFIRAKEIRLELMYDKRLICKDYSTADLHDSQRCNFETGSVNAVYGRTDDGRHGKIVGILNEVVGKFGPHGGFKEYFRLFAPYDGERNVIFNDDTQQFNTNRVEVNGVTEQHMNELVCNGNVVEI